MTTTFKNKKYKLITELIKVGTKIQLELTDKTFQPITISKFDENLEGQKAYKLAVLSVFPSINTSVCDEQTKGISELAHEFNDVRFISVSVDLPSAIEQWLGMNGKDNIEFYSDHRRRSFGQQAGFLIDEIFLLNRGFLILDKDGTVLEVEANSDVHQQIDFNKLKELIQKHK
ncbi:redoxin domain-containing protein [Mesomycoplasma hyorhinis]|uniref:redoxin domain-containing protein n=1 Tax=Mesomycoplasma hyorhinis TaxID=2100 RepID=UPI00137013A1|nr:redoxin domain-containing protein [Mesomycoplasma hyorhinis]MXR57829.1 peroxiredoxin [Mesomycoplasma hyorhinis]